MVELQEILDLLNLKAAALKEEMKVRFELGQDITRPSMRLVGIEFAIDLIEKKLKP